MRIVFLIFSLLFACKVHANLNERILGEVSLALNPSVEVGKFKEILFPLPNPAFSSYRYQSLLGYALVNRYKIHERTYKYSYNLSGEEFAKWTIDSLELNEYPFSEDMIKDLRYRYVKTERGMRFIGTFSIDGHIKADFIFVLNANTRIHFLGIQNRYSNTISDSLPLFVLGGDVFSPYDVYDINIDDLFSEVVK